MTSRKTWDKLPSCPTYFHRFIDLSRRKRCAPGSYLPNNPKNDDVTVAAFCRSRPVIDAQRAPIRPQIGELTQSSKIEYATGVTSSVSNRHNVCPPITTTEVERLMPAPGPLLNANGAIPAT